MTDKNIGNSSYYRRIKIFNNSGLKIKFVFANDVSEVWEIHRSEFLDKIKHFSIPIANTFRIESFF